MGDDSIAAGDGHAPGGRPGLVRALGLLATYPRRRWVAAHASEPYPQAPRASITGLTHDPARTDSPASTEPPPPADP